MWPEAGADKELMEDGRLEMMRHEFELPDDEVSRPGGTARTHHAATRRERWGGCAPRRAGRGGAGRQQAGKVRVPRWARGRAGGQEWGGSGARSAVGRPHR